MQLNSLHVPTPRVGRTAALAASALAIATLAACSSGGSTAAPSSAGSAAGTSAESAAPALSGDPVKALTYVPLNSKLPTYPAIGEAATLYAKWVNDNGGINGRPLEVTVCDEQGDPTAAANCVRKAVQDGVTAVVGSYGFTGDVTIPILEEANTAYFGACCVNSAAELSSPIAFNMGNGPMYGPALAKRALEDGHTNVGLVLIDGAQSYEAPIKNALEALGSTLVKTVILPAEAQDYSPQVAEATDGTDALIMIVSEGPLKAWMAPFAASGSTAQLYGPQGNLDPAVAVGYEELLNGAVIGGSYPDIALPMWDDLRAAMEEYGVPEDLDFNTLAGLGTWAAYTGFRDVASQVEGELNNQTFLDQANKTTALDTGGMVPELDFTKPWTDGLEGYTRLFNRGAVLSQLQDGLVVPLTSEFEDMTNLAMGKPQ